MTLPLELIHEIVYHTLDSTEFSLKNDPQISGQSIKPSWSLIEAFTLTCKTYRNIALEAWFSTLFITDHQSFSTILDDHPMLSHWARRLQFVIDSKVKKLELDLSQFTNVTFLRVDRHQELEPDEEEDEEEEDDPPSTTDDGNTLRVVGGSRITELEMRGLDWPSPMVFTRFAKYFPALQVLKLSVKKTWCGLCHTCVQVRFGIPPPEPLTYANGLGLPRHYALALNGLKHLHTVLISVASYRSGIQDLTQDNPTFWVGECDRCMVFMYEDVTFMNKWISKKKGIRVDEADRVVYVPPPHLKKVQWQFYPAPEGDVSWRPTDFGWH